MKKTNLIAAKFLASLLGRLSSSVTVAEDSVKSGPIMIDSQYVCHKAASPLRFPPTVGLTPVVARRLFGRRDV